MRRHQRHFSARRRSYWLGAANYCVLAATISFAVFFLVWGMLHDPGEELPWVPAGIAGSLVLIGAVVLRQAFLRKIQKLDRAAERLDRNLLPHAYRHISNEGKLTIEKNAAILRELERKSDAARVLAKYSDGHREVFELCGEYLEINQREMHRVGPGSPRTAALRHGKDIAEDLHRRHMLKWAEIEARSLLEIAQLQNRSAKRIDT